jgi:hypothetical protein
MKYSNAVVTIVTGYLVLFCVICQLSQTGRYALYMFLASPALVVWMVLSVLKDDSYEGGTLGDDEFGYGDRP